MSSSKRIKDKLFYGWIIVAACLIVTSAFLGIRFSFGVFLKSLQGEFDITRAAVSSVFSTYMLFSAIFAILSGWALDRYGPKLVISLMGLFTGLSLLLTSQVNSFWQLYLAYSLLLAIGTGGAIPVVISAVSRWFDRRRGTAIGITTSGGALGTFIVAPSAAYLITSSGWRISYIVIGLVCGLVVILLALLMRRGPREIGTLPDGRKPDTNESEPADEKPNPQSAGLSLSHALRTQSFWLIMVIWWLFALCISLILTHVVAFATDAGVTTIQASIILSVMSAFQIPFRLLIGRISDAIGRIIPGIICAGVGTAALIWLIWADSLWMFYLFAVVFGFFYGGLGVINLTIPTIIFEGRRLGTIMGVLEVGFLTGSAAGSILGGYVFDITGSYAVAFAIGSGAMLIISLLLILSGREARLRRYNVIGKAG